MKSKYFTKIENKYYFNISLIFWHLILGLIVLAIVASVGVIGWGLIPPSKDKVIKPDAPSKQAYPASVNVELGELLARIKPIEIPSKEEEPATSQQQEVFISTEDNTGKEEYYKMMDSLKKMVPSKKLWESEGYWNYPQGEKYWLYYKSEQYRKWEINKPGYQQNIENKFQKVNINKFTEKKSMIESYISFLSIFPSENREIILKILIDNTFENSQKNIEIHQAIKSLAVKMNSGEYEYMNKILHFVRKNPNDGKPFVLYLAGIIEKFDVQIKSKIVEILIQSYNYYFKEINRLKESTELFIPLITQIEPKLQDFALVQYYEIYREKNAHREESIKKIDSDFEAQIKQIELNYQTDLAAAELKYNTKKLFKTDLKLKSLMAIGIGIVAIAVLALILVLLSLQRSVKIIEENLTRNVVQTQSDK